MGVTRGRQTQTVRPQGKMASSVKRRVFVIMTVQLLGADDAAPARRQRALINPLRRLQAVGNIIFRTRR